MTATSKDIKDAVRNAYRTTALKLLDDGNDCCTPAASTEGFGTALYAALDTGGVPDEAVMASLGCGNPTAIAGLRRGERVLDLGSGGGLDVFLAAKAVGPEGFVFGLDMTDEMLELARRNQQRAAIDNVEFLKGEIEDIPLPDASVDVVISNCVINLSVDKAAVFHEAHRVLRPGGRFAVSDVVALHLLTEAERADLASWAGCIAGAITAEEYVEGLESAGFRDVVVEATHEAGPTAVSARITATA
jgi:SAM-dependent methyltransferase